MEEQAYGLTGAEQNLVFDAIFDLEPVKLLKDKSDGMDGLEGETKELQ